MSMERGPSPEEMGIKQEKKEEETGFGDLLELAQEVQATEQTPAETVEEKTQKLKAEEKEAVQEKTQLEKATDVAFTSGRIHYKEITNPIGYKQESETEWAGYLERDRAAQASGGVDFSDPGRRYESGNRVTEGSFSNHFPEIVGTIPIRPPRKTEDYLPNLQEAMQEAMVPTIEWRNKFIDARKRGKWVGPSGEYDYRSTPEEIATDIERFEKEIKEIKEQAEIDLRKHAEGFGMAALESGDLAVAVDNLDAAGILEKPDIIASLKARMVELKASEKTEDRLKLRKISEKLLAIQARKTSEAKK